MNKIDWLWNVFIVNFFFKIVSIWCLPRAADSPRRHMILIDMPFWHYSIILRPVVPWGGETRSDRASNGFPLREFVHLCIEMMIHFQDEIRQVIESSDIFKGIKSKSVSSCLNPGSLETLMCDGLFFLLLELDLFLRCDYGFLVWSVFFLDLVILEPGVMIISLDLLWYLLFNLLIVFFFISGGCFIVFLEKVLDGILLERVVDDAIEFLKGLIGSIETVIPDDPCPSAFNLGHLLQDFLGRLNAWLREVVPKILLVNISDKGCLGVGWSWFLKALSEPIRNYLYLSSFCHFFKFINDKYLN